MCFKFILCKERKQKRKMLITSETSELLFRDRDRWKLIAMIQQKNYLDRIRELELKLDKYKKHECLIDLS